MFLCDSVESITMKCSFLVLVLCYFVSVSADNDWITEDDDTKTSKDSFIFGSHENKSGRHNSHEHVDDEDHSGQEEDDEDSGEYEQHSWSHRPYNQRPNGINRPVNRKPGGNQQISPGRPNNFGRPIGNQNFNPNGLPYTHAPVLNNPIGNNVNQNGYGGSNPNFNRPGNFGRQPNPTYPTFNTNPSLNVPYNRNPTGAFPTFNNGLNTNPNLNVPYNRVPPNPTEQGISPPFNNFQNPNLNANPNLNIPNNNFPINNPSNFNRPGPGNQFNNNNGITSGQCPLTSVPPSPQTGCCGREASSPNTNNGMQSGYINRPATNYNQWAPPPSRYQNRYPRDTDAEVEEKNDDGKSDDDFVPDITLDNRIAGGKETNLLQFPWTVFLKTTFDYGTKKASFNCGGSLISARYVLTAAHCITEDNARVSDVDIILAEYDKRTFPRDCIYMQGEGRKCIENIMIEAENIIPHPEYDSSRLQNDIALVKLRGNAPFTDFIRPICLPPINVDNPQYSDLRLAVAGWGRNGTISSSVKQSTVVNLVPQRQCSLSYPHLTEKHLCAAGHSGEDTCKGDSGGPLMMLYEGQYYVSGVVSGKRADSPCGTNVPSLYTNVFHYIDWINRNIVY